MTGGGIRLSVGRFIKKNAMITGEGDRIYIPTEAGIPILEAK